MAGADPTFRGADEFREVLDRLLKLFSTDPDLGPRLRAADLPSRFEVGDLGLVLHIRPATPDERDGHLRWTWEDDVDWAPRVTWRMDSPVVNRFYQGRENVAVALARQRIRMAGDRRAALALIPLIKPFFVRYRAMLEDDYPHLVV